MRIVSVTTASRLGRPALDCHWIPGCDVAVSTRPSASVRLDESVSITSRTARTYPAGSATVLSSAVAPPWYASRL